MEPGPQTWEMLRRETARSNRLVSDLSELWRAEARQLPLRIEDHDVAVLVAEVIEQLGPQAGAHAVVLRSRVTAGLLVRADRDRVAQILTNYLVNAIRHSPEDGRVDVDGARVGHEVVNSVRDVGAGLTPEQRAHVFDRFYRVDRSRSRALGGAGIGLAIVAALAGAMGGRVWALSEGPGRGSTFSVALPAA